MVKANELKPDNLIYFNNPLNNDGNRVVVIDSVKKSIWSFQEKHDHGIDIWLPLSACSPIPLTPEWLERCGFVKTKEEDSNSYTTYTVLKMGAIQKDNEGDGYFLSVTDVDGYHEQWVGNRILSLHQLQNLYFALTGEELNVKL